MRGVMSGCLMTTSSNSSLAEFIAQRLDVPLSTVKKWERCGSVRVCISIEVSDKPNCANVPDRKQELDFELRGSLLEKANCHLKASNNSSTSKKIAPHKHAGGRPPKYDKFEAGVLLAKTAVENKQFASRQELADAVLAEYEQYALRPANVKREDFEVPSSDWIRPLVSAFAEIFEYQFKNDNT